MPITALLTRGSLGGNGSGAQHIYERLNISRSLAETAWAVLTESAPSFRTRRCQSTARSWSRATCPCFPWKRTGTLVGYDCATVVMGATMTVRRCWFISSGEMTRQGRAFCESQRPGLDPGSPARPHPAGAAGLPLPFLAIELTWSFGCQQ
jgi:hypothetical protein